MTETGVDIVRRHLRQGIGVREALLEPHTVAQVATIADVVIRAFQDGHKAIIFGNGGSAADAQHLAAEFVGRYRRDRRPLPAIALAANAATLTAIGNDYGFEQVFARQVEALGAAGDVAIGISTSGRSLNVAAGLTAAARRGLTTIALTGRKAGPVAAAADYCLRVPADSTPDVQEAHLTIAHTLCELVERGLFEVGTPDAGERHPRAPRAKHKRASSLTQAR